MDSLAVLGAVIGSVIGYRAGFVFRPVDPLGALAIICSLLTGAGIASIRPRWRPAMSTLVGFSLAGWAWVTALFGFQMLSGGGMSGLSLLLSTALLGIAYLIWFRWKGQAELARRAKAQRDQENSELHQRLSAAVRVENQKLGRQIRSDVLKSIELVRSRECPPIPIGPPPYPPPSRTEAIQKIRRARRGG